MCVETDHRSVRGLATCTHFFITSIEPQLIARKNALQMRHLDASPNPTAISAQFRMEPP
jgi:hypothetical protein